MSKLVFLDLETTGLDPRRHEILEVGMIVRDGLARLVKDREIWFSLEINESRADPKALEVSRYETRRTELRNVRITRAAAQRWFEDALKDAVVIGNNIQFDLRFIEQWLINEQAENSTPWHYHPVDIKAYAAGRLGMGSLPWKTTDIAEESGVKLTETAHTAIGDARWNRDVYDAVRPFDSVDLAKAVARQHGLWTREDF